MASFNSDELGRVPANAVANFLSSGNTNRPTMTTFTVSTSSISTASAPSSSSSTAQQNTAQVCIFFKTLQCGKQKSIGFQTA